jgi:hypothetical protein
MFARVVNLDVTDSLWRAHDPVAAPLKVLDDAARDDVGDGIVDALPDLEVAAIARAQ